MHYKKIEYISYINALQINIIEYFGSSIYILAKKDNNESAHEF